MDRNDPTRKRKARKRLSWKRISLLLVGALPVVGGPPALYLTAVDAERQRARLIAAVQALTGHQLDIDGEVAVTLAVPPVLSASGVRLSDPADGAAEPWLSVERLDARVGLLALLLGTVEVRQIALVQPALAFEERAPRLRPAADDGARRAARIRLRLQELTVQDLTFTRRREDGFEQAMQIDSLALREAAGERMEIAASGRYRARPASLRGTIGTLDAIGSAPYPIAVMLETDDAYVSVDGAVEDRDGAPTFAGALRWAVGDGAESRGMDDLLVSGSGAVLQGLVELSAARLALEDFWLVAGSTNASGDLALTRGEGESQLSGSLFVDRLDLDRLDDEGILRTRPGRATRRRDGGVLDPGALDAADGALELRVGELVWDGTTLRELRSAVILDGGRLEASPIELDLLGEASVPAPLVSIDLSARRFPIRKLLEALGGASGPVEGRADVAIDIASRSSAPVAEPVARRPQTARARPFRPARHRQPRPER